jgi:hypothetical protein
LTGAQTRFEVVVGSAAMIWVALHVARGEQTRSEELLAVSDSYSSPTVHSERSVQLRSEKRVGGSVSYLPSVTAQTVRSVQLRSELYEGATVSYCAEVHTLRSSQPRSLDKVGAAVSYWVDESHTVRGRQLRSPAHASQ